MIVNFCNQEIKTFNHIHTYPGFKKITIKHYHVPNSLSGICYVCYVPNLCDYLDIKDEKLYYVEFLGHETFDQVTLEEFVEDRWIEPIRNGDVKLALHMSGHGYHQIIESIYVNLIGRDRVPAKNIYLSSESFDIHKAVDWYSKKFNLPAIKTRVTLEYELGAKYQSTDLRNYLDGANTEIVQIQQFNFQLKSYNKKYLCLNGFFRQHRAATVFLLAAKNLLKDGYVSYNIKDSGGPSDGASVLRDLLIRFNKNEEIIKILQDNYALLSKIDNILLDTTYNQSEKCLAQILPEHNIWFNDTYFSLVTETNFPFIYEKTFPYNENEFYDIVGRLFSEKIFRCFLYKHPFLVTAPKHFLKILHSLGYKTFSPYIDESYDDEQDDATRLLKIVNEAERLCNLNQVELKNFLNFAKGICDHNFENLKKREQFVFDLPYNLNAPP